MTDAIQLAIRAGTLEALSLENDNQRDEVTSNGIRAKISVDKRKPLSLEELPANLTAMNIHEFTNVSLRRVYELMNMNQFVEEYLHSRSVVSHFFSD